MTVRIKITNKYIDNFKRKEKNINELNEMNKILEGSIIVVSRVCIYINIITLMHI